MMGCKDGVKSRGHKAGWPPEVAVPEAPHLGRACSLTPGRDFRLLFTSPMARQNKQEKVTGLFSLLVFALSKYSWPTDHAVIMLTLKNQHMFWKLTLLEHLGQVSLSRLNLYEMFSQKPYYLSVSTQLWRHKYSHDKICFAFSTHPSLSSHWVYDANGSLCLWIQNQTSLVPVWKMQRNFCRKGTSSDSVSYRSLFQPRCFTP